MALVERVSVKDLFNSGTKIFFLCKLANFLVLPQGLNWVARVRFEYLPPIFEDFPVIAQTFIMDNMLSYKQYYCKSKTRSTKFQTISNDQNSDI